MKRQPRVGGWRPHLAQSEVPAALRLARVACGVRQAVLERTLGLGRGYLWRIENGVELFDERLLPLLPARMRQHVAAAMVEDLTKKATEIAEFLGGVTDDEG